MEFCFPSDTESTVPWSHRKLFPRLTAELGRKDFVSRLGAGRVVFLKSMEIAETPL